MELCLIEQDYMTISDFINSLNETNKTKIDIDYLLKLFVDEKLNFYLKIKGNQEEIYISDRSYFCSTQLETYGNTNDNLFVTNRVAKEYRSGEEINLENNNFHFELSYLSCDLITKGKYKLNNRRNLIVSDEFCFEGMFRINIYKGFINEIGLDLNSYLYNIRKSIRLSNTGLARLICAELEIHEDLSEFPDISIDTEYDKIFIDYLNEVYLSKVEIDILNKDFELFTKTDDKKSESQLNGDLDHEMYQSIINALVFLHHPKFQKVNRKSFFITDKNRPSFNAISEAISDILEEMQSKVGYSGKVRKAKTIAPFLEKFLDRSQYY
ncbi:hypothetical protein ABW51_03130 [Haemophilus sp. C1]|nr:hypothetical protein ABW51_03130 [Haemophilus sp. C1]